MTTARALEQLRTGETAIAGETKQKEGSGVLSQSESSEKKPSVKSVLSHPLFLSKTEGILEHPIYIQKSPLSKEEDIFEIGVVIMKAFNKPLSEERIEKAKEIGELVVNEYLIAYISVYATFRPEEEFYHALNPRSWTKIESLNPENQGLWQWASLDDLIDAARRYFSLRVDSDEPKTKKIPSHLQCFNNTHENDFCNGNIASKEHCHYFQRADVPKGTSLEKLCENYRDSFSAIESHPLFHQNESLFNEIFINESPKHPGYYAIHFPKLFPGEKKLFRGQWLFKPVISPDAPGSTSIEIYSEENSSTLKRLANSDEFDISKDEGPKVYFSNFIEQLITARSNWMIILPQKQEPYKPTVCKTVAEAIAEEQERFRYPQPVPRHKYNKRDRYAVFRR